MIYYSYSDNFPFSSEVLLSSPLSLGWTWLCSSKDNLEQVMASKINSEYAYGLGGGASVLVLSQHSLFSWSFFHSKFSACIFFRVLYDESLKSIPGTGANSAVDSPVSSDNCILIFSYTITSQGDPEAESLLLAPNSQNSHGTRNAW